MSLSPDQQKAIEYHSREIAKILHTEADPAAIETLEGIEKTVRDQVLEHVSPSIGIFWPGSNHGVRFVQLKQANCLGTAGKINQRRNLNGILTT